MIAPELRPWASSLRVLDVSDLRVNVEQLQSLAETIVLMPNLATIKQRNVDPSFLLNAMRSCREIGGTLPPLQQMDLSQLNTGAVYDWSALVPALLAVRETLNTPGAEIMLSGLFSSCDAGQQMKVKSRILLLPPLLLILLLLLLPFLLFLLLVFLLLSLLFQLPVRSPLLSNCFFLLPPTALSLCSSLAHPPTLLLPPALAPPLALT